MVKFILLLTLVGCSGLKKEVKPVKIKKIKDYRAQQMDCILTLVDKGYRQGLIHNTCKDIYGQK
jgi:hypothetical protein